MLKKSFLAIGLGFLLSLSSSCEQKQEPASGGGGGGTSDPTGIFLEIPQGIAD